MAAALVLSFLCGLLVYHSMGFLYAIGDDVIMRDIASGAFTGTPDGHLVFVRYILGFVLSRLYLLNGKADWYGFLMAGAIFLGLSAILYRGLSAGRGLLWKAGYTGIVLGLFGVSMVFHAAQFEWTLSAAMLGGSGLYLYVTASDSTRGQRILEGSFIWLLLFLTFCIRYDVFFMTMPGFGIAFLWKALRRENGRLSLNFAELPLPLAVFLAAGLAALVESFAYNGQDWETFQRFQTARSEVYDYSGVPSYEGNPAFFEELGLDEHDIRNLRHYALYLVDGMDAAMMERLSLEAVRQHTAQTGFFGRVKEGLHLTASQLADPRYFPVSLPAMLFVFAVLALAFLKRRELLLPFVLFLGTQGILWLGLGVVGRLPERVALSMYLVLLLCAGGYFYRLYSEAGKRDAAVPERTQIQGTAGRIRKRAAVFGITVLCLGLGGLGWKAAAEANREKLAMDDNYQIFKRQCREEQDSLYFIETYMAEPVGGARVTANGDFGLNRCLTLGDWYSTSPLDERRFEALGIENVKQTILTDPNAYLVVRDIEDPGFFGTYFQHRYPGSTLVLQTVKCVEGRNYYLYQVTEEEGL